MVMPLFSLGLAVEPRPPSSWSIMDPGHDPRVFFAAERTLLAWVRTGIGVIGLGFVVARFGLFLHLVSGETPSADDHSASSMLGVFFIALGSVGMGAAIVQFLRFIRTLPESDRPRNYFVGATVAYSALLGLTGAALAIYLFLQVS
jgi:putative membrane protein